MIHKSSVGEVATTPPNAATAFTINGTLATGYLRSFATAYTNTQTFPYFATNGVSFESGVGTLGTGTIARTKIDDSTTGSAIDWSAAGTPVTIFVELSAALGQQLEIALASVIPGGRLTLTTGVPVTATDVTLATTVYYTPYLHDRIALWDGFRWIANQFVETSLALGTLTAAKPYDIFGYLNAGVLATELLAWFNDTTRTTAITLQDGRYCKSGDKTRLYLGTFYTTSTTQTEDSSANRFVWNMYNREARATYIQSIAQHTYTGPARKWNNNNDTLVGWITGLSQNISINLASRQGATTQVTNAITQISVDGVALGTIFQIYTQSGGVGIVTAGGLNYVGTFIGKHNSVAIEIGNQAADTFFECSITVNVRN